MGDIDVGRLMDIVLGLYEKKLAFAMEQGNRKLSLEERAEANKTDLEYAKLNALIKSDKDKIDLEDRKIAAGHAYGFDLQKLTQAGLVDLETMKSASAEKIAKWKSDDDRVKTIFEAAKKTEAKIDPTTGTPIHTTYTDETTVPKIKQLYRDIDKTTVSLADPTSVKPVYDRSKVTAALTGPNANPAIAVKLFQDGTQDWNQKQKDDELKALELLPSVTPIVPVKNKKVTPVAFNGGVPLTDVTGSDPRTELLKKQYGDVDPTIYS